jgi:hypothetical protein
MANLFIPLKKEWYKEFENGTKTVEYRKHGPRWNERTCTIGRRAIISNGYGKQNRLEGTVKKFWVEQRVHPVSFLMQDVACIEIEHIKPWNGTL